MKKFIIHIIRFFDKSWVTIWIDRFNPPKEGDTITIGRMKATFYEVEKISFQPSSFESRAGRPINHERD